MTERKKQWLLMIGSFLVFGALALLYPYTGDDWDWGCHIGMDRLMTLFADYNGRYMGNLLVILQTRVKALDILMKAFCCVLAPVLCVKYSGKRDFGTMLFALGLFLLMPRGIFAQSIVWTAGFVNYVPSALISVGYLVAVREADEHPLTGHHPGFFWLSFLAGLVGAWFMENITIFNIALGVFVAAWVWWKHRKVYTPYLGFPLGAVLGAAAMFANSGYRVIAQGEDFYRQTPTGLTDTVKFMADNLQKILGSLILDNWALCLVVTALLLVLAASREQTRGLRLWKRLHGVSLVLVAVGKILMMNLWKLGLSGALEMAAAIGVTVVCSAPYVVTVFVLTWLAAPKQWRMKLLLPLGCVLVCMGPLLVVRPIGDRCMFPGDLLLMVYGVSLLGLVREQGFPAGKQRLAALVCAAVVALQIGHLFAAYYPIHVRDRVMNDYALRQSQAGQTVIAITDLSEDGYVHCSYPYNDIWWNRYCLYYGLNTDTYFELLTWEELQARAAMD